MRRCFRPSIGGLLETVMHEDSPLAIALMIAALLVLIALPMLIMPSDAVILSYY